MHFGVSSRTSFPMYSNSPPVFKRSTCVFLQPICVSQRFTCVFSINLRIPMARLCIPTVRLCLAAVNLCRSDICCRGATGCSVFLSIPGFLHCCSCNVVRVAWSIRPCESVFPLLAQTRARALAVRAPALPAVRAPVMLPSGWRCGWLQGTAGAAGAGRLRMWLRSRSRYASGAMR